MHEEPEAPGHAHDRHHPLNVVDILLTALANADYDQSVDQLSRTHIVKGEKTQK